MASLILWSSYLISMKMMPFKSEDDVFHRPRACTTIWLHNSVRNFTKIGCNQGCVILIWKLEMKNCLHFERLSVIRRDISRATFKYKIGIFQTFFNYWSITDAITLYNTINPKVAGHACPDVSWIGWIQLVTQKNCFGISTLFKYIQNYLFFSLHQFQHV